MMRYFGFGIWSLFDSVLIIAGVTAAVMGIKGYMKTKKYERNFPENLISTPTASGT